MGLMAICAFAFPVKQLGVAGALAKVERVLPQALLAIIQPRELVNLLQALVEQAFHLSETASLGCEP